MSTKVVVYNADYDKELLKEKIKKALDYFNLPTLEGKKILIKPNLLMSAPPEKAITTHPILI